MRPRRAVGSDMEERSKSRIAAVCAMLAVASAGDRPHPLEGYTSYETNCAACHGQNGKGDGPVSAELRTKPSDLTLIAKKNGGVFPGDVLYRIIDGRRTIRAHG